MSRILLVDDEESIVKLTSFMLTSAGYQVISATNGEEALEIIEKQYPDIDLIISDHIMPKMNGLELTERVSKYNIPIIMVTAMVDEFTREIPYYAGARDFITKPFTKENLKNRVSKVLDKFSGDKLLAGSHSFYKGTNIIFHGPDYLSAANDFINLLDKHTAVTLISNDRDLNTDLPVLFYKSRDSFIPELIKASEEAGQTISEKRGGFRILVNFPLSETALVKSINNSSLSLGDLINVYFNSDPQNRELFDEVYPC